MVCVAGSYTALGPVKSLQQAHFPVLILHWPPVFAHLGSQGGGKGGCFIQPGFLKTKTKLSPTSYY